MYLFNFTNIAPLFGNNNNILLISLQFLFIKCSFILNACILFERQHNSVTLPDQTNTFPTLLY